jgi:tetratricopeptide (TPR) repeat protein
VEHSLELAPRNAQAHALQGYLFSAQNRIAKARESFDQAIGLDGALGNAWLGRGLTFIRQGQDELGRRDLQTAAVLEPNRSIFRSYLGKAFSEVGSNVKARSELTRAKELDPNDPTPWLYSAIQHKQENRYNEAVDDLEKSIELNDNRRVYRSQFLLDQDRSIRGTNLASIFLNDGMREQSVREAVRAVDDDYSSAPAHLFLANSYNALRDPTRILLRYETAWFNELLLSNLLSPVGGGPLSQFVSEQEYSKMFEHDGLGVSSVTDYFSYGEVRETGSQYGTFGNISYALDAEYQYNDGIRPNNRISRLESYGQIKVQVGPQDTLFFQTKYEDLSTGDVFQHYDPREVQNDRSALTLDFHEKQDPALLLLGWHHEWSPGNHTLLLVGRLANEQTLTSQDTGQAIITRDVSPFTMGLGTALNIRPEDFSNPFGNPAIFETLRHLVGRGQIVAINTAPFDFDYRPKFETYTAELQHIVTVGPDTIVAGGRYQNGEFRTRDRLTNTDPNIAPLFDNPAADQAFNVGLERINLYLYNTWRVAPWLSVTGGVTYDDLHYPDNFRSPPINNRQRSLEKVSPKAGFILQPAHGTIIRGAYTEAISGASFDESIRLEPTQVAGFTQAYRTLASESFIGSVAGSKYKFWGISVEQKLPTRTFVGAEFDLLKQNIDRTIGVFDFLTSVDIPNEILPSSLGVKDNYREDILTATINQLLGENWSLGARYRYTRSHFHEQVPDLKAALLTTDDSHVADLAASAEMRRESDLHELNIFALYNHPSGFFATSEAKWYKQDNDTLKGLDRGLNRFANSGPPGDDFWQFNVIAGWRFYRNQCEVSCGCLNINDTDYKLDPLNPYVELPRSRTLVVRAKISF